MVNFSVYTDWAIAILYADNVIITTGHSDLSVRVQQVKMAAFLRAPENMEINQS